MTTFNLDEIDRFFPNYRRNEEGDLVLTGSTYLTGRYVVMEFIDELEAMEAYTHFEDAEEMGKRDGE